MRDDDLLPKCGAELCWKRNAPLIIECVAVFADEHRGIRGLFHENSIFHFLPLSYHYTPLCSISSYCFPQQEYVFTPHTTTTLAALVPQQGTCASDFRAHNTYMAEQEQSVEQILQLMDSPSKADIALVRDAYDFALQAHKGHARLSGEPYFNHLYATAYALAELGVGPRSIAAGLLHDSIEDVGIASQEIEEKFGPEVLFLVEGVTKLGALKYRGAERHVESLRRLFVATSQDIRVLLIKLMDRLHNMRTLHHVPKEKQERIAKETLEIYAPIADRLGMGRLKRDLEDLAFPYLYPDDYTKVSAIMSTDKETRFPHLEKIVSALKKKLEEEHVHNFRTEYRIKGLYSLFKKLQRKDNDLDRIHDLLAVRIIVKDVEDCYRTLGVVHQLWRPLPGKIKDYIAFEKPNGYQSIHTTVLTREAGPVEIQIRTEEMHRNAQFGIASHLNYKESLNNRDRGADKRNRVWYQHLIPSLLRMSVHDTEGQQRKPPQWVQDLARAHEEQNPPESKKFMDDLRADFFSHRVFVFTPRGDVVDLPIDSSPIDFAYAIHSDIGDHIAGAKVNGKLAALDSKLRNGDIVEIETRDSAKPSNKWLDYAKTSMARKHISASLSKRLKQQGEPTR